MKQVMQGVAGNPRAVAAVLSFTGLAVGFGLAWLPLGFIVPSAIVFVGLSYSHLRGP